jgi:hypothetical protein
MDLAPTSYIFLRRALRRCTPPRITGSAVQQSTQGQQRALGTGCMRRLRENSSMVWSSSFLFLPLRPSPPRLPPPGRDIGGVKCPLVARPPCPDRLPFSSAFLESHWLPPPRWLSPSQLSPHSIATTTAVRIIQLLSLIRPPEIETQSCVGNASCPSYIEPDSLRPGYEISWMR